MAPSPAGTVTSLITNLEGSSPNGDRVRRKGCRRIGVTMMIRSCLLGVGSDNEQRADDYVTIAVATPVTQGTSISVRADPR